MTHEISSDSPDSRRQFTAWFSSNFSELPVVLSCCSAGLIRSRLVSKIIANNLLGLCHPLNIYRYVQNSFSGVEIDNLEFVIKNNKIIPVVGGLQKPELPPVDALVICDWIQRDISTLRHQERILRETNGRIPLLVLLGSENNFISS